MNIFVATSYSSQVDFDTGHIFPEYKKWLEQNLSALEKHGHTLFCALRADQYRINNADPAAAFKLDIEKIKDSDALLAFVDEKVSAGVQTEIGYALAIGKQIIIAHQPEVELAWFNQAMVKSGQIKTVTLPLTSDPFSGN